MEVCSTDGVSDSETRIVTIMDSDLGNMVDHSLLTSDGQELLNFGRDDVNQDGLSLSFQNSYEHSPYDLGQPQYSEASLTCSVSLSTSISPVNPVSSPVTLLQPSTSDLYDGGNDLRAHLTQSPINSGQLPPPVVLPSMLSLNEYGNNFYPQTKNFTDPLAFSPNNGYSYSPVLIQQPPTISPIRSEALSPATAYSPPATAYSAPATAYSAPATAYSPPATAYSPPATAYSPPATAYSPPATAYSPHTTSEIVYPSQRISMSSLSPRQSSLKAKRQRTNHYRGPMKKEILDSDYSLRSVPDETVNSSILGLSSTYSNFDLDPRDHRRHPSGDMSQSPITAQSPSISNPYGTSSYVFPSGQFTHLIGDGGTRLPDPIPVQQHQHQVQLFQNIPVQATHHQMSQLIGGSFTDDINTGDSYENTFGNSSETVPAGKSLSFNYIDLVTSQTCEEASYSIPTTFQGKVKTERRVSNKLAGAETNLDKSFPLEYVSASEDEEKKVLPSRTTPQGYECAECQQVCRTRGALRKHLVTEHKTNEPDLCINDTHKCPILICNYFTVHRDQYDEHIATHLKEGYTPMGKKRLNKKTPLLRHRYNKEELQCPVCPYSCTVEKSLKVHIKGHENGIRRTNKLSCSICGIDKDDEVSLRKHMDEHKFGRTYKCDICCFHTVQLKKLIQHRRMHTGEKPHLCPFCTYRAARRDNLRSHVRRMHKKSNMYCDTFTPRRQMIPGEPDCSQYTMGMHSPEDDDDVDMTNALMGNMDNHQLHQHQLHNTQQHNYMMLERYQLQGNPQNINSHAELQAQNLLMMLPPEVPSPSRRQ